MKKLLLIALTVCGFIGAQSFANPLFLLTPYHGPGSSATYLIQQGFEGAGYDNSESWTESGSTINEDYTGIALVGSQSLRINTVSAQADTTSPAFASTSEIWGYCRFRPVDIDASTSIFGGFVGSGADRLELRINSSGQIIVFHGSNSATTIDAMSEGTTYHVWWYYKVGTGVNGLASVGFSTDGTKPTSGNKFVSLSNGTATQNITTVHFGNFGGFNRTIDFVFDRVLVDDVEIGSNP